MSLPNPGMVFTAFDPLPAASLNDIVANVEALAAGTGLDINSISASKLSDSAITLGYAQITTTISTTSTSFVAAPGLSKTVTIPDGGRNVEITVFVYALSNIIAGSISIIDLWDGSVGTGTEIQRAQVTSSTNAAGVAVTMVSFVSSPAAGSKTYSVGYRATANSTSINCGATFPAFILIKLV